MSIGSIFKPAVPEGYEWVVPRTDADYEALRSIAEWSAVSSHVKCEMILVKSDEGQLFRRADMPWLGSSFLVLRDQAIDTVGSVLKDHGELIPLLFSDGDLAIFNAPLLSNVLDRQNSDLEMFDSGQVLALRKPSFNEDALGKIQAFRLEEMPRGSLFLGQELVNAVWDTGMSSGTDFHLVYSGTPSSVASTQAGAGAGANDGRVGPPKLDFSTSDDDDSFSLNNLSRGGQEQDKPGRYLGGRPPYEDPADGNPRDLLFFPGRRLRWNANG